MNDLDLWHVRQPITASRMAHIITILLKEVPRRKRDDPFEVLSHLDGDRLGALLALMLDYPPSWVQRNFSACGALQCLAEFLRMEDLGERTKEAKAILKEDNYGRR